jgi:hypothetical protein
MGIQKNKQQRVDEEVQATLRSLDSLEQIEASPFFQTRLRQATKERTITADNWFYRFTRGYKLVPAGLLLFIALNAVSLAVSLTGRHVSSDIKSVQLRTAAQEYFSFGGDVWSNELSQGER